MFLDSSEVQSFFTPAECDVYSWSDFETRTPAECNVYSWSDSETRTPAESYVSSFQRSAMFIAWSDFETRTRVRGNEWR